MSEAYLGKISLKINAPIMQFGFWTISQLLVALLAAGCSTNIGTNTALADLDVVTDAGGESKTLGARAAPGTNVIAKFTPNPTARAVSVKSVALVPPRVFVYELDASAHRDLKEEWSMQARQNLQSAVNKEFQTDGIALQVVADDSINEQVKANLQESYALLDTIRLETMPVKPPGKFDHLLGGKVHGLNFENVDALIFVTATDHVWTAGRQALVAAGYVVSGLAGAAGGALVVGAYGAAEGAGGGPGGLVVGGAVGSVVGGGLGAYAGIAWAGRMVVGTGTEVDIAMVDARSGAILWYQRTGPLSSKDLRDAVSTGALMADLFKESPLRSPFYNLIVPPGMSYAEHRAIGDRCAAMRDVLGCLDRAGYKLGQPGMLPMTQLLEWRKNNFPNEPAAWSTE